MVGASRSNGHQPGDGTVYGRGGSDDRHDHHRDGSVYRSHQPGPQRLAPDQMPPAPRGGGTAGGRSGAGTRSSSGTRSGAARSSAGTRPGTARVAGARSASDRASGTRTKGWFGDRGARDGGRGRGTSGRNGSGRPRRRGPVWAHILIGLGVLVMLGGLGAITFVNFTLDQLNGAVRSGDLLGQGGGARNTVSGSEIKGPINILLLGVDTRPTGDNGSHSDSMIIAHIPASHDRVYLISIPRDTGVIAAADKATHFSGGPHKLTDVFSYGSRDGAGNQGGFQLVAATIKRTWGISFNGAAIVDFNGFTDIINKLGGVDMVVDETTVSIHHGYYTDDPSKRAAPFNIDTQTGVPICSHGIPFTVSNAQRCAKPGISPVIYYKKPQPQHLTPYQALDFVRCRDGLVGTDYARQRHQQQFIKAVMQEAFDKGLSDPLKMQSFVTSIGKAFIFDRNGVSLTDWIFTLKGLSPSSMVTIKTNNGQYVRYDGSLGPIPGSVQGLNSDSQALLAAVQNDRAGTDLVGQWLSAHSDWAAG